MTKPFTENQELVSYLVACQLVIKQILDVIDIIAPAEVGDKMSAQLKNIDFGTHPAAPPRLTALFRPDLTDECDRFSIHMYFLT